MRRAVLALLVLNALLDLRGTAVRFRGGRRVSKSALRAAALIEPPEGVTMEVKGKEALDTQQSSECTGLQTEEKEKTPLDMKETADCMCELGFFWFPRTKQCIAQKDWGYECGFFPRELWHRVCKDGLVCEELPTEQEHHTSYNGESRGHPASCQECKPPNECTTGEERHLADCLKQFDVTGESCATVAVTVPVEVSDAKKEAPAGKTKWAEVSREAGTATATGCVPAEEAKRMVGGPEGKVGPKMADEMQAKAGALALDRAKEAATEEALRHCLKETAVAGEACVTVAVTVKDVEAEKEAQMEHTASAEAEASATAEKKMEASAKKTAECTVTAEGAATATAEATDSAKASSGPATVNVKETATAEATVTKKREGTATAEGSATAEASSEATASATATGKGTAKATEKAKATATGIATVTECVKAEEAKGQIEPREDGRIGPVMAKAIQGKGEELATKKAYENAAEDAKANGLDEAEKRAFAKAEDAALATAKQKAEEKASKAATENAEAKATPLAEEAATEKAAAKAKDKAVTEAATTAKANCEKIAKAEAKKKAEAAAAGEVDEAAAEAAEEAAAKKAENTAETAAKKGADALNGANADQLANNQGAAEPGSATSGEPGVNKPAKAVPHPLPRKMEKKDVEATMP